MTKVRARILYASGLTLFFGVLGWLLCFGLDLGLSHRSFGGPIEWDASVSIWRLWHLKQAVLGRADFFFSDYIFYPMGIQMIRQEWFPVVGLMSLPFHALGPVTAYNLQYALAYVLTGVTTYLLCKHLSRDRAVALLCSVLFTFCEYHVLKAHFHGQPGQAHQEFMPLYLLFLLLYLQRRRRVHALLAGLSFVLATFTSGYQMIFLFLLTVPLLGRQLVHAWWHGEPASGGRRAALRLEAGAVLCFALLAGGVALLLIGPILLYNWSAFSAGLGSLADPSFNAPSEVTSYFISSLVRPPTPEVLFTDSHVAFLGYTLPLLLLLGVALLRGRTGAWFWCGCALLFFVLSLGPTPQYNGRVVAELPFFHLMQQIPIIRGARFVSRFSSLVTLCLVLCLAQVLGRLNTSLLSGLKPLTRGLIYGLLVLLAVADLSYGRFIWLKQGKGFQEFRVPRAYRLLARDPQDATLLTYPLAWESRSQRVGDVEFPPCWLMAFQPFHGKRLLTGFGDAIPDEDLRSIRSLPFIAELSRIPRGDTMPLPDAQAIRAAQGVVRRLNIRYILVHRIPFFGMPEGSYRVEEALRFMRTCLHLEQIYEDRELLLFKVSLERK